MAITTEEEAVESNEQHTRPCHDCPWRRKSIVGWLGGRDPAEWLKAAQGEERIDCHTVKGEPQPQCAGAAIYRANILKLPRDPSILRLKPNRATVFASPVEFFDHHAGVEDAPIKREPIEEAGPRGPQRPRMNRRQRRSRGRGR